jgi:hypothetical protein
MKGSVKNQTVAVELAQERGRCDFDQYELTVLMAGGTDLLRETIEMHKEFGTHPELINHFKFYELTPDEQQRDLWARTKFIKSNPELSQKYFQNHDPCSYPFKLWVNYFQGSPPGISLSLSMFMITVQNMANQEQRERWLPLIRNCNILGCYA